MLPEFRMFPTKNFTMKSRNLLSAAALASAVVAIAFAAHQARQHRSETARLREQLEQALSPSVEPPAHPPASAVAQPPPSREAPAAASAAESPATEPGAAAIPETEPWLAQFDRAMDREFTRIEEREKSCQDPAELALLAELKTALMALDQTWAVMDAGEKTSPERETLANQARNQMMAVIRLAAADRNLRLARVAHTLGVEDAAAIDRFIADVDEVFRDTDLDWASLFNRGF